jgi:repressor LexA
MKKKPLTEKQRLVFEFIKMFIEIKGFSPCLQEIATGLNMRSRSNIHRIVHCLENRNLLSIVPLKARSLKLRRRRSANS